MSTVGYVLLGVLILLLGIYNILNRRVAKPVVVCPKCKAANIVKVDEEVINLKEKTMQGLVMSSEYIATVRKHYRCQNCGNAWQTDVKEVR